MQGFCKEQQFQNTAFLTKDHLSGENSVTMEQH